MDTTDIQTRPAAGRFVAFEFDLNSRVLINEVQRPGSVDSLMVDYLGVQYRVSYWDNGDRKSVWLKGDELSAR